MISYTCDNCGQVQAQPTGTLPNGWYAFTVMVQSPPVLDGEGNPLPPGPPEMYAEHADKKECYDAIIGGIGSRTKKP